MQGIDASRSGKSASQAWRPGIWDTGKESMPTFQEEGESQVEPNESNFVAAEEEDAMDCSPGWLTNLSGLDALVIQIVNRSTLIPSWREMEDQNIYADLSHRFYNDLSEQVILCDNYTRPDRRYGHIFQISIWYNLVHDGLT